MSTAARTVTGSLCWVTARDINWSLPDRSGWALPQPNSKNNSGSTTMPARSRDCFETICMVGDQYLFSTNLRFLMDVSLGRHACFSWIGPATSPFSVFTLLYGINDRACEMSLSRPRRLSSARKIYSGALYSRAFIIQQGIHSPVSSHARAAAFCGKSKTLICASMKCVAIVGIIFRNPLSVTAAMRAIWR